MYGADQDAYRAARSFSSRVTGFRRIPGGMESRAYSFRAGSDAFVLRVNRDVAGFEKDAFVHEHFASESLPIPEVVKIGAAANGDFYCISRKLAGRTLEDLRTDELPPTLDGTLQAMRAIATAKVNAIEGFGPFDPQGRAPYASWREFLLSATIGIQTDHGLVEVVRTFLDFCPEMHCLVHGDFGSNNVLTDGRRITGVLDWSEAMIGDPLYDVANIFFWRGWLECMEALATYLEKQMHPIPNWRERVHCYQACIALHELAGLTIADSKA